MTDHTLFSFPAAKAFTSGKIIICAMWVERLDDEWIAKSSPMFATSWPGFHKFSRGPFLMTFFTAFPASGWTRNFVSTTLNYRETVYIIPTMISKTKFYFIF